MTRTIPRPDHAPPAETRVGVVTGERLCAACGFNLMHQPIVREPHYSMLLVRCPECAAAASLQEYPSLGRWAGRWAALLAGLWLLFLTALLFGTAGLLFAMSEGQTNQYSWKFARVIAERHAAYIETLDDAAKAKLPQWIVGQPVSAHVFIDQAWWDAQDGAALRREAGGWARAGDWGNAGAWFWIVIAGAVLGGFWSIALLYVRRPRLLLFSLLPLALAGAFHGLTSSEDWSGQWGGMYHSAQLARRQIGWPVVGLTLGLAMAAMWTGLWLGRPAARLAVRAMLPPRQRGALAFLWLADEKTPPLSRP